MRIYVHINMYMSNQLTQSYLKALELVNLSHLSKESGRAYRTLQAYRMGDRRVTEQAAQELAGYLRERSQDFVDAADTLDAAQPKGGKDE